MKTTSINALIRCIYAACVFAPTFATAQTTATSAPAKPDGLHGWLKSANGKLQVGQRPTVKWGIAYPSKILVGPPGITGPRSIVKVQVLGQGATNGSTNGIPNYVQTRGRMSIGGSRFRTIFDDINTNIIPNRIVPLGKIFGAAYNDNIVEEGQLIRFGGQSFNGIGKEFRSGDGTGNIRFLQNGDTPPSVLPASHAPSLESFLRPILDASGKVCIGPLDVIVFFELTHTKDQMSHEGYDMQDLVFLVSFVPAPLFRL